jgi:hypothetical protein
MSRDRGFRILQPALEVAPRNDGVRHDVAFPRRRTPELCFSLVPSKQEGAGKAGCWPHPWPASKQKSWRQTPQVWPNNRPSLRDGVTAYSALSPETGLSCPRRRAIISRDLTSASGGQDHTPSPSASASLVRVHTARATLPRPSHPAPNVRDDREAPLLSERGTAWIMLLIYGKVN